MRMKRGYKYKITGTPFTLEIHPFLGTGAYLIRHKGKEVATRSSRKAAINWAKKHKDEYKL